MRVDKLKTSAYMILQNAIGEDQKAKEKETPGKTAVTGFPKTTKHMSTDKARNPKLVCPGNDAQSSFFSIPCKVTKECVQFGNKNMLCCNNRCLKGVPPPPEEPVHSPTLFGLIDRVCPSEHIPELLGIKQCKSDSDCPPRICCPEKMPSGEMVGYCRTPEPKLDRLPVIRPFMEPLKLIMSYMQCTPPPPALLDLFPKECNTPLDCFPNLCCQERGKQFCRPAKRSLLTLITTVAQRIVPSDAARDFINRITS
ncbi:hypothetical protein Zmor_020668 [Zophobas morio]|uniref:WAP domain-containing protein n=1 Tax=Zophobas morio TaxID=2755281 RepID=A0AA38I823_9CUCU|nr:hypothetical protein Zmor_020668 [Zophobas morio]